jgi:hypothetical protein
MNPQQHNSQKSGDMTKPISTDEIEFIELDGLKIRFQRNQVEEGIPVVLASPWPESLCAYQRIWPIVGAEASLFAFNIAGFGQSEGRPQLMSPRAMHAGCQTIKYLSKRTPPVSNFAVSTKNPQ